MTTALGCIAALGMGFFSIAFLIDWFESWEAIRKYLKYGIWAGLIVEGSDLLIVAITPSSWEPTLIMGLIGVPIIFLKHVGFTMLGMYYLAVLGYPSFPVLLQKFSVASDESNTDENIVDNKANTRAGTTDSIQATNPIVHEIPEQVHLSDKSSPALDLLLDIKWKDYFLTIFGVSVIGILYSVVLFLLTTPQLSEIWQKEVVPPSAGIENAMTIQVILVALQSAVAEEVIFRLGIQSFLAKYLKLKGQRYWIAILITSVLWTLAHAGGLEPAWVKLAQIFPIGLMLGWLFRKYGAESTILAHGLFNIVLVFLLAEPLR
ncbi:MAG: CPBP family intramembrane glutamic endopeptidase [Thermodesulfobacteriota bacterium]